MFPKWAAMSDNEQAIKTEINTGSPQEHKMSTRINLQTPQVDGDDASTGIETGLYSIFPKNPQDTSSPSESNYAVSPRDDSDYLEIIKTSNPPKVSSIHFSTTFDG